MVTESAIKTWGKWTLRGNSLAIPAPAGSLYSVPLVDLQGNTCKFWIRALAVKRWISIEDMFDFRRAFKEITGRRLNE